MNSINLTPEQWEVHQKLVHDYSFFSRHIQKIEPKDIEFDSDDQAMFEALWREDSTKGMVPFVMRPGQRKLHLFVEEMKRRRGMVAAALVKPRQVGWSTYIQGRAHWLSTKVPGLKTLIVSHTKDSTGKFLRRIRKMCAAAPPTVTPGRPLENSKEIGFANGAYISIATAGSPDAVRSDNAQFFHASEETSWENAVELAGSIFPALSYGRGSENYRETTSKGKGTPWHEFILEAHAGDNRWEVFFDPYFNDPRYRLQPPPGWQPNDEACDHADQFLRHMQEAERIARLYWRHLMIKDLRAVWMFKQEFPADIWESFQSSENTLYNPDAVYRAQENGKQNAIALDPYAPLVMGVDPARTGDKTVICFRQGKVMREFIAWDKMEHMQLVGIVAEFLAKGYKGTKVAKCFIDYALGESVADHLHKLGYYREVQVVHFANEPREPRYANKRTEMFMDMRDWFGDTGEHVSIPHSDKLVGDLLAIPDFARATGTEKVKVPSKDQIKKTLKRSPDYADAAALTFAFPVAGERAAELQDFAKQNLRHLPPSDMMSIVADFDR